MAHCEETDDSQTRKSQVIAMSIKTSRSNKEDILGTKTELIRKEL